MLTCCVRVCARARVCACVCVQVCVCARARLSRPLCNTVARARRRPAEAPTEPEKLEGLIPYNAYLPLFHQAVLSHGSEVQTA